MRVAHPRHDSDCVAAVLASLLEVSIDEVPDFWNEQPGKKGGALQYERVRRWLAEWGYHYYYASCKARAFGLFQSERFEVGDSWPPRGYWIGRIERVDGIVDGEAGHVVVMKGHRCVFNPSGTLRETREPDVFLTGYYLLIPLDPAEL